MIRRVAICLAALIAAACGDDAGPGLDGGGDAAPPADGAGSDAVPPPFPREGGLISVGLNATPMSVNLSAGFWKTSEGGTGCERRTEGACTITSCGEAATSGLYAVSAGDVTATDGVVTVTAAAMANGTYGTGFADMAFPPGTAITVAAAGDDVTAFSDERVMPPSVAVTEPASATGLVVDRAMPFTVRWTPGTGSVYLYIDTGDGLIYPITSGVTVRCVVPSEAGEHTMEPALLAELMPGMGTIAVTGIDETTLQVGGFEVAVRAIAYDFVGQVEVR